MDGLGARETITESAGGRGGVKGLEGRGYSQLFKNCRIKQC